jgi:lipase chaperone LimK
VPEDIPSGQDDDVVARQIREAAMNESDPVLRDKLWQEYRDYKASISGGGSTEPKAEPASATEQPKE